jgi:hypothetical protein
MTPIGQLLRNHPVNHKPSADGPTSINHVGPGMRIQADAMHLVAIKVAI